MAEEEFSSLDEELNVQNKRVFHKWFLKSINEENKEMFRIYVDTLGKAWNVKRTVPKRYFKRFVDHLWKKYPDIINGSYKWDKESFSFKSGVITKRAYSYESKVCFAIAPTKYKIIYDDNTRKNLKTLLRRKKRITLETFETAVNEWLAQNNIDTTSEDALFRADYALWSREAVDRQPN